MDAKIKKALNDLESLVKIFDSWIVFERHSPQLYEIITLSIKTRQLLYNIFTPNVYQHLLDFMDVVRKYCSKDIKCKEYNIMERVEEIVLNILGI